MHLSNSFEYCKIRTGGGEFFFKEGMFVGIIIFQKQELYELKICARIQTFMCKNIFKLYFLASNF
jgi:hypothetical protein